MQAVFTHLKTKLSRHPGQLLSVAIHLGLAAILTLGIHVSHAPQIEPYRLPGIAHGEALLTYYAPGSLNPSQSKSQLKSKEKPKPAPARHEALQAPEPIHLQATEAKAGIGASAESGQGEGEITIALQTYFPYPKPDLTVLPHGTVGDVILDAEIDENGKIAKLSLLKGLGSPIDDTVIATVRRWQYTPAMKNGVPVPSEQELHFHYERG